MYFCVNEYYNTMNRLCLSLLLSAALFLVSCEKSVEEPARRLLDQAKELYAGSEYNAARLIIDSISVTYPKAYKTRREAEILRREVMLKEKQRDVEYFASMYGMLVAKRDSVVAGFSFTKDAQYQDMGYYTVPSQAIALNPFNNFLRASVKENGDALLTSFYRGARISHNTVKVSAGDSFVECSTPFSSRTYKYLGVNNERRDYRYGNDGGIMDFIAAAPSPVTVELKGEHGRYEYTLRPEDVAAVRRVIELSNLLKSAEEARSMRDEAQRSLDFLLKSQLRSQENND